MNVLSHVKAQIEKTQRLREAQAASLRTNALVYRGVGYKADKRKSFVIETTEGKRYSCTEV